MSKKKKSNNIKVKFILDFEKYSKWEIKDVSLTLYLYKLKNKGIAKEVTEKEIAELNVNLEKQEELKKYQKQKEEERKIQEDQQKEIKKKERKMKEEVLKKLSIKDLYAQYSLPYTNWKYNSLYFNELSENIAYKLSLEDTITKIRHYYNMLIKVYYSNKSWKDIELKLILTKAKFDESRKNNWKKILSKSFYEFLEININWFKEKQDLKIFKKQYEAIISYYKYII